MIDKGFLWIDRKNGLRGNFFQCVKISEKIKFFFVFLQESEKKERIINISRLRYKRVKVFNLV